MLRFQADPNDPTKKGAHLPFFFNLMEISKENFKATEFKKLFDKAPESTAWVVSNLHFFSEFWE